MQSDNATLLDTRVIAYSTLYPELVIIEWLGHPLFSTITNFAGSIFSHQDVPCCQVSVYEPLLGEVLHSECYVLTTPKQDPGKNTVHATL